MKQPKAVHAFIVAEQFRVAVKLMYRLQVRAPRAVVRIGMPSIVCAAFSLELYLKSLLRLERKQVTPTHDLWKLFHTLGRRNQRKIRKFWRTHSSNVVAHVRKEYRNAGETPPKVDFDFCLRASRLAFLKVRYIHEFGGEKGTGWLADAILHGARIAILERHPEWEGAMQSTNLPTPGTQSTSLPQ